MSLDEKIWFEQTCQKRHLELSRLYLETLLRTADWIVARVVEQQGALFLSISGAQGSGKSTFAGLLKELFELKYGYETLILSLDDFYLTRAERLDLARSVHPLLSTRGVPGTHDVQLLAKVIDDIKSVTKTTLPRFNKAEDERLGWEEFPTDGIRIVICEGWCWGAKPVPENELSDAANELELTEDQACVWRHYVNAKLAEYQRVFKTDQFIFLAVPDMDSVLKWRWQQEQALSSGSRVMNFDEIRRFVMFYDRISRNMLKTMPDQADLTLKLGTDHEFIM